MTLFSVLCNLRILFIIYFVIKFDLINSCWRSGDEETSSTPLSLSGCADLFIQYGTPSILEKQNQITPTTTSTSCIPDGNLYCYPSGPNPPTPETFMIQDGFATSIPETDCKNFCACSEDGTCYVKIGQVDSVRIAPYCNLNGVCCNSLFFQSADDNGGVMSEDMSQIFTGINQLSASGTFKPFTCDGGNVYPEIISIGCNGCDDIRDFQCTSHMK